MLKENLRACRRALTRSVLLGALPLAPGHAAVLTAFDFDGPEGAFEATPDAIHAELFSAEFSDLAGTLGDFAGVSGRALSATGFNDGNAIILTLVSAPDRRIEVDRVRFAVRVSASGPNTWQLAVGDEAAASGPATTSFGDFDIELPGLGGNGSLTLALSGLGASSSSGTLRLDDVSIEGTVSAVPLPPALLLAAVPLALLGGTRRDGQAAGQGHSRQPSTSGK
ncbi:MAG: hypothetical protein WD928_02765 [Gammaproteobacteria bacterium]